MLELLVKKLRSVAYLFLVALFALPIGVFGTIPNAVAATQPSADFNDISKYRNDSLVMKLQADADLELDSTQSFTPEKPKNTALNRSKADRLNSRMQAARKRNVRKLVGTIATTSTVAVQLQNSLGDYYVLDIDPAADVSRTVADLTATEGVETVYPVSKPTPTPTTANYIPLQKYLNASPDGIDSNFAKTFPGGRGQAVKVIDLEYSWNENHEDLAAARGTLLPNGTPVDPFNDTNHGTAVLGELIGTANGIGVRGMVNTTTLRRVNTYNAERGWDIVGALQVAALTAKAGDVILIEQQTWAPASVGGFAPVEWEPAIYDAIKVLTTNGINVVQAAGNSGHNLDNAAVFGSTFPAGKAHSGAVIVGAGSACSQPMRSRLYISNYGNRVDLQGHGECVTTTGYGYLDSTSGINGYYTSSFSGTSSASPMVAAAIASLSSAHKTLNNGTVMTPAQIRNTLVTTGTAQYTGTGSLTGNIGPLPNLRRALLAADKTAPSAPVLSASLAAKKPKLTWTTATDNVAIKEYHVYRNGWWVPRVVKTREFSDTTAVAGTKYTYRVYAVDTSGLRSVASNYVTITSQ